MREMESACINYQTIAVENQLTVIYQSIDRFVTFLTTSSILIGIMGFFLPYFAFMLYGIPVNYYLLVSSFLLTFAIYSHNKLTDLKEDAVNVPERAGFIENNKKIVIITLTAGYFIAILLAYFVNPFAIAIVLFPILCGFV